MIRKAKPIDASDIMTLWNGIIRDTFVTFTTEVKTRSDIEVMIVDPERFVLVASYSSKFAGFALFGPFRSGPGYARTVEHTIYLSPAMQNKGIGTHLMSELEKAAHARGHHAMVGAISGQNTQAVEFHKKLGFDQVARMPQVGQKQGQWLDLVLMQKILGSTTDTVTRNG